MDDRKLDDISWLDHMTGYLTWIVIGPDIHNPYKTLPTVSVLKRMVEDSDFLCKHVSVRCSCDGHEVLTLNNPSKPRIHSSHPSVSGLQRKRILGYMKENAVDELIQSELEKIRVELRELIKQLEKKMR